MTQEKEGREFNAVFLGILLANEKEGSKQLTVWKRHIFSRILEKQSFSTCQY